MPHVVRVRFTRESSTASLRVAVDDGNARPVEGIHSEEFVRSTIADVERALAASPIVSVAGRDVVATRREVEAGQVLGRLLLAAPELARHFGFHLGSGAPHGRPVVLVDAADPILRSLPWELLPGADASAPLESTGEGIVVRLVPGSRPTARPNPASRLRVYAWSPTPADPVCAARLTRLRSLPALAGLVRPLDPGKPLPATDPDLAVVLHVVSHGRRIGEDVEVLVGPQALAAGSAAHALTPILRVVDVVLLDVCEAGDPTPSDLAAVAARIVAAGAPACIAPVRRVRLEAADRFGEGFYEHLAAGGGLCEATAAGRRAVRGMGVAQDDARWRNHVLYVAGREVAARDQIVRPAWAPPSWPDAATDAARLLDAAHGSAVELRSGFVGLEHLALAMLEVEVPIALARVVGLIRRKQGEVLAGLRSLEATEHLGPLRPTPRLVDLGLRLGERFSLSELWQRVIDDPGHHLHELLGASLVGSPDPTDPDDTLRTATDRPASAAWPEQPAIALLVAGGPEDGRLLRPDVGHVVGRYSREGGAHHALYQETAVVDRRLSRAQIRWLGAGRIETPTAIVRLRDGRGTHVGPGTVEIAGGDLLLLSGTREDGWWGGTRLRALGDAGSSARQSR